MKPLVSQLLLKVIVALLGNMHRSFSKMFLNYAFGENRKLKNTIKGNKFGQLIAG